MNCQLKQAACPWRDGLGLVLAALGALVMLAGCGGPAAALTPAPDVKQAREIALRDTVADNLNDYKTLYADREANPCFKKQWPNEAAYETRKQSSANGQVIAPVSDPNSTAKLVSTSGDSTHKVIKTQLWEPGASKAAVTWQYAIQAFNGRWAIVQMDSVGKLYPPPNPVWAPCWGVDPDHPGTEPPGLYGTPSPKR